MQFPQIRMESKMAKIGMEQTNSYLEIEQPKADLSIEQPKAELSIETTKGKLTIDQTQAWEETNLMSTLRLIEKLVEEAKKAALQGTARRAEQGAQLIDIHKNINVIAEQAIENGAKPIAQLSIKYIPSPFAVKINYEPGEVRIDVKENKPIIDVQVRKPEVTFHRGGVRIYMEQYNELKIEVENLFSAQA